MKIPAVTVLMPVYNGEKYLVEAIESILGQTFSDFELLIIDDGSTDGSLKVIKSFSDSRINLVENKINRGVITSLNLGLDLAKGKYIARMDADDISVPTRLSKQVAFMEKHPSVSICGTWLSYFTRIPGIGGKFQPSCQPEEIAANLMFENVLQHPTIIMRKFAMKGLHYPLTYPHAEDYALWVSLMDKISYAILPEILLHYRLHKNQIGQTKTLIQNLSVAKVHKLALRKLGIKPTGAEIKLHEDLCFGRYELTSDFMIRTERWLTKILESNLRNKLFPQIVLRRIIANRWLTVCLMNSGLKGYVWNKFWQSPLHEKSSRNIRQIQQLWLETTLFPFVRPYIIKIKQLPIIKQILLG